MSDVADDELVPGLSGVVVERLRSELGGRAEKVLGCLRTAAALVAQAEADVSGLRLAESAAYNLREALDHVAAGQDAAEGGLGAVMDAWRRFKTQMAVPGADAAAARDELDQVLSRVAADESRASYYARRLLTYLQDRAGVRPLARPGDLVSEYGELRYKANVAVHNELALAEVATLLSRTVAWFVRVFTPPDQLAEAIRTLAAQPWSGQEQVAELQRLATNDHHLRLFFSEVTDPGWLEPLHEAGVVQVHIENSRGEAGSGRRGRAERMVFNDDPADTYVSWRQPHHLGTGRSPDPGHRGDGQLRRSCAASDLSLTTARSPWWCRDLPSRFQQNRGVV